MLGSVERLPPLAQLRLADGHQLGLLPVVGHEGPAELVGAGRTDTLDLLHGSRDRLQVELVATVRVGVDAVAGEQDLARERGLLFVGLWLGGLEDHLAGFLQPGDFQPHVDGRNAVMVG